MRAAPAPTETTSHSRLPADERRRQLIEVSIDLFARKGFAGTTTKEIAAAAGVTEAIIFRHFATKQDLYTAILEHMCSRTEAADWMRETQRLMNANDDEALIRNLLNAMLGFTRVDSRYERLIMYAALEGNEFAVMHHNELAMPFGEKLLDYITRRQRDGAFVNADPKLVLYALIGPLKFYTSRKYLFGCGEEVADERAVDDLVRIILNGIKGPSSHGELE